MIGLPAGVRAFLAAGTTDMRKGFDGLATMAQSVLHKEPSSGAVFAFHGKRGDLIKLDASKNHRFNARAARGEIIAAFAA